MGYSETRQEDLALMLASRVHVGTQNCSKKMKPYVYTRNKEGIHYLNISKSWEKLMIAARVIAAINNPKDVLVVANRQFAQRAILKFATHTGANYFGGKWTPGSLTNQNTKKFQEPRLIIVCDPRSDHQAIKESAFMNVPANNKGRESIAIMFYFLAREVLMLRGTIPRDADCEVLVDLFMHRDITVKKVAEDEEEEEAAAEEVADVTDTLNKFKDGEEVNEEEEADAEEEEGANWGQ